MQKVDILKRCLELARRWRCPPHWQPKDWREELTAVAWAALWEGLCNEICSESELQRFVVAALMRRYREEWNFGIRWVQPTEEDDDEGEPGWDLWEWASTESKEVEDETEVNWLAILIRQTLTQLSEEDRYLIERRFWDGATEREIASELGISQPAVHKRLKRILERMRTLLQPFGHNPP